MLLLVILLFGICWSPRLVMNVVIKSGLQSFSNYTYIMRVTCYLLSFVHSALNPFVYGFMSTNFRSMILNSCTNGSTYSNIHSNIDPTANHHIIGCSNIRQMMSKKRRKKRRSSTISNEINDLEPVGSSNHLETPITMNNLSMSRHNEIQSNELSGTTGITVF